MENLASTGGRQASIVHVIPALFGNDGVFGGAERYAYELSKAMSDMAPTTLISFGSKAFERQDGRLAIHVLRNWIHFRRFKFDPFNAFLPLRLKGASIIHVHQTHTLQASLSLVPSMLWRSPVFTTDLGGGGFGLHRLVNTDKYFRRHLHITEYSLRKAGSDRKWAEVIYGGVNDKIFFPDPSVKREQEVLFVGRLLPHKGINYLVEAMDTDIPLRIVGRKWSYAEPFYQLLHQLATGKRISFHEDFDDNGILNAYRRAMCVVLPSVHKTVYGEHFEIPELLGQTLLEAMACQTPVICTTAGAMHEVVEDGVCGFVVPENDAGAIREKIRWMYQHPEETTAMGIAARERVLRLFTFSAAARRCLQSYKTYGGVDASHI